MSAVLHNSPAAKDAMREQWNKQAKGWNGSRAVIRPWLHGATQAMLGIAGIKAGSDVLDVAAGAGDQTLDIAERVNETVLCSRRTNILLFASQQAAAAGYRNVKKRMAGFAEWRISQPHPWRCVCCFAIARQTNFTFFVEPLD